MTSNPAAAKATMTAKPIFQNGDLLAAQVITLEIMTLKKHAPMMTIRSVKSVRKNADATTGRLGFRYSRGGADCVG